MHVRSAVAIAADRDFTMHKFSCIDDHTGWFEDYQPSHMVVLVRSGMFRVRSRGVVSEVDRTSCYLGVPGAQEDFAHPATGEICTVVTLTPRLWRSVAGESAVVRPHAYTSARIEFAHRRLLAAQADPGYALTEELLELLTGLVSRTADQAPIHDRSTPADLALVEHARSAILAGHPVAHRLGSLADELGVSPYRLSRAFPRILGVSLTHYRNRVRITRALDRLEAGEPSLASLAADLGFADQAHLTRTVRTHLGHTPTALRRLLTDRPG
ncbi:AraC family transcriptional regulator [Kribbella sp. NPDC006257]|uniref:helix-turn-helix domain-containing protein n=1 Tax=Kribbella sp. NPDC006257 TaxID=3156738 RepID=UPI0033AF1539